MNILIISDALIAPLYIPRIRFLNNQLLAAGHNVSWYAEETPFYTSDTKNLYSAIPDKIRPNNLIEIPYYHSSIDRIIKVPLIFLFDHKNRYFARHIVPSTKPDIVFVSTFHTFGLRAGLQLAKRYKCKLHVDLRDIAEQTPANSYSRTFLSTSRLYRYINIQRRNYVLRRASTITTVSRFHKCLISRINANTHIVYNGYDSTIFKPSLKSFSADRPLNIIYTGRWYGPEMQDPLPLFRALQKADFPYNLDFYTSPDTHSRLQEFANRYDVSINLHPYVPNDKVPELLNTADVALVLTSPSNRGILTTKFFEALGTSTPVLCVPSDRGELASLIHSTNAGIATSNTNEILTFLRNPNCKCNNPNEYSRQQQTTILINLICAK